MLLPLLMNLAMFGGAAPAAESATVEVGAGRARGRRNRKILVRLDGEFREVDSVEELLALIKAVKREAAPIAEEKAREIVLSGKRIGDAKREEPRSIEVIQAPAFAVEMIETRIKEMEIHYWKLVERALYKLMDEEDEIILLH